MAVGTPVTPHQRLITRPEHPPSPHGPWWVNLHAIRGHKDPKMTPRKISISLASWVHSGVKACCFRRDDVGMLPCSMLLHDALYPPVDTGTGYRT
jgi:hypothetical protein